ncbi:hypothetical protein WA026_022662 [Henosepilachna vigintioctopunctata]|uniref:Uncharacterized protein n=1 Tax=Henosepilachna vigintioctopunctata TaxID=420089 RepID=A0AAW1TSW4_9CUCU
MKTHPSKAQSRNIVCHFAKVHKIKYIKFSCVQHLSGRVYNNFCRLMQKIWIVVAIATRQVIEAIDAKPRRNVESVTKTSHFYMFRPCRSPLIALLRMNYRHRSLVGILILVARLAS